MLTVDSVRSGKISFREFVVEGDSFDPTDGRVCDEKKQPIENPAAVEPGLAELGKIASLCNDSTIAFKQDEVRVCGLAPWLFVGSAACPT